MATVAAGSVALAEVWARIRVIGGQQGCGGSLQAAGMWHAASSVRQEAIGRQVRQVRRASKVSYSVSRQ